LSFYFSLSFWWDWGLNLALHLQSRHSTAGATPLVHFVLVWSWGTICQVWPWTKILPISASQVARIIGVSHQCRVLLL
jgi:hypothetical protein